MVKIDDSRKLYYTGSISGLIISVGIGFFFTFF